MNNALILTQLLLQFAERSADIARLLNLANTEGRDVTDAELDGLAAGDDRVSATLQALIAAKKG